MRGDQQILEDFLLVRLDQRRVDLARPSPRPWRSASPLTRPPPDDALDLDLVELVLHRLHLRSAAGPPASSGRENPPSRRFLIESSSIDRRRRRPDCRRAVFAASRRRPAAPAARRSAAHVDDLGAGKARQHRLDQRIGRARRARARLLRGFRLRSQRRLRPASAETTTIQRRPVHCSSLRDRSLTSVCAALGSSAISSRPSSKRTSRTSRSSAGLVSRSRFSAASATSSAKAGDRRSAGAACGIG